MTTWPPPISRALAAQRLEMIFPREAFDTTYSGPAAAAAVAVMLYVGAVHDPSLDTNQQRYIRPTTVVWMRESALTERSSVEDRERYYRAAIGHKASDTVSALMEEWDVTEPAMYRDNSRETIRDEVLRHWLDEGPVTTRPGLAKNAGNPKWLLQSSFAKLFDPTLEEEALTAAIDAWVHSELSSSAKIRLIGKRARDEAEHAVIVELPDGQRRKLEAGAASQIIKGVIEKWATQRLQSPMVLAISEPGEKTALIDGALMSRVGITIDAASLLPDLLIADAEAEPVEIWVVEIVHSDGEINETRKRQLTEWAARYNISANQMRFLTAFASRNAPPARKRLKDLASDTYAWYADEPGQELYFGPLHQGHAANLAIVTPLGSGRAPRG